MCSEVGPAYDRERLKDFLLAVLDRIELEPRTLNCEICYRIPFSQGNKLASPRGFEPRLPP